MKLKKGMKAPAFKGLNEKNEEVSLADYKGEKLVIYFYPKDNTPACTDQACNLRDNYQKFLKQGYQIIGISADSVKRHQNFIKKYNLPFSLIADTNHSICELYGVWAEKVLFGRKYMGIVRTTFIIDEKGKIIDVLDKIEVKNHTRQIL
jgi:peroxiredoxin Q/BCP